VAYEVNKPFEQAVRTLSSALFKRGIIVAWLTLIITLSITAYAWYFTKKNLDEGASERFNFQIQDISYTIKERMETYEQVLRGAQGLFYASNEVTRDDWREYVNTIKIDENYPGILGIGFSRMIKKEELTKHIEEIRKEGFTDYRVWPEGERNLYTSVLYLEPFNERNKRAFGYDMFSDPVRRKAMNSAKDNRRAAISGKITLVQEIDENIQPGFIMYISLFKKSGRNTPEERNEELIGYVYGPFRMNDLINGIIGDLLNNIKLEIYDDHISKENLMFSSNSNDSLSKFGERSYLQKFKSLNINGRDWILHYTSLPGFDATIDRQKPLIVLILGIVVSSLLFIVVRNFGNIFITWFKPL